MEVPFLKPIMVFTTGAVLMLLVSFTVYRQSYYYKKAAAEAGVAEKPSRRSRLVTVAILLVMILFFVLADLWIVAGKQYSFGGLAVLNLVLIGLLSLFDGLFIDYFMLVVWRPAFLRLPSGQPTRDSMVRHMKLQFTAGWLLKAPIALLGAAFANILASFG